MENVIKKIHQCFLAVLLCTFSLSVSGQSAPSNEYQVKAAFLFNFTQFIDWPAQTFSSPEAPFVIGVLGQDPFGYYLEEIAEGEQIDGHPLTVKRFNNVEAAKGCQLLFINPAKGEKLSDVLHNLKETNVLTVGEASNFAEQGGMIGFLTENRKVRIQINLQAAQRADLTVSSKLLRVAEIVSTGR